MPVVSVIIGSTREGRFGDKPGRWIVEQLAGRPGVDVRLLDLRDYPMPFFDQKVLPSSPGRAPYDNEVVQSWTAAIDESDAFVVVAAEYNFGPPAVLKNALDWVYREWNRKPVGFVSYGGAAGVRCVQQLRLSAVELQMVPLRAAVHLPRETLATFFTSGDVDDALDRSDADAQRMIDELFWWIAALGTARTVSLASQRLSLSGEPAPPASK